MAAANTIRQLPNHPAHASHKLVQVHAAIARNVQGADDIAYDAGWSTLYEDGGCASVRYMPEGCDLRTSVQLSIHSDGHGYASVYLRGEAAQDTQRVDFRGMRISQMAELVDGLLGDLVEHIAAA